MKYRTTYTKCANCKSYKQIIIALLVVCAFLIIALFVTANTKPQEYTAKGFVTKVNGEKVVAVRIDGEAYEFCGKGYEPHQQVIMTFSNMGTSNPYDDEIISVTHK